MSTSQQLMPVPFYEDTLVLVGQDNEPFVAMKSVAENMGLAWQTQHRKILEKFSATITIMVTVAEDGKPREMVCLPLRKLPAWLNSINPTKVKPELRDKIIRYQEECDDALWDYWTKGTASRVGTSNVTHRIAQSRHRLALAKELHRTRDPGLREVIHQQLDEVSRAMGLPTPELESLGRSAPKTPDALKVFWEALAFLDGKGVEYNHATASNMLALNLRKLASQLLEHGQPLRFDTALRQAMWQSHTPRCLHKNYTIHSRLTGKSIKCWVFERLVE